MKNILLASASAFAFAGAAAAEVTFGGSAELGYNDLTWAAGTEALDDWGESLEDNEKGFYWSAELYGQLTMELNNGLTAGAGVTIEISDGNMGQELETEDYVLWLESENAGLYFGTTDTAAGKHWRGTSGMDADNFTTDAGDYTVHSGVASGSGPTVPGFPPPRGPNTHNADDNVGAAILRGDISYGGIDASVSYLIPSNSDASHGFASSVAGELEQLSVGASGSFGNFNFSLAYQDGMATGLNNSVSAGDFSTDKVYGVSVGTTFGGADILLAYAHNADAQKHNNGVAVPGSYGVSSVGIEGSYPIGPVTLGAYYVNQPDHSKGNRYGVSADYASGPFGVGVWFDGREHGSSESKEEWGIDASYDVGNGLTVYAGTAGSGDAPYIGGEVDMGNGATLGLSYADDSATHYQEDSIGARGYQEGATAWVSFTF